MSKEECVRRGLSDEACAKILNRIKTIDTKIVNKVQALKQKRIERLSQLKNDRFLSKIDKAKDFRARVLAKERIALAKTRLLKAKEKLVEAKAKLEKARLRFEQAKALKACKEDPESDECIKAKDELKASAKEKLLNQAEIIEDLLNKALAHAESNEALTDEEAEKITSYLQEKLDKLAEIKQSIESAEDKTSLVDAAKELGRIWRDVKHKANAYLGRMINARYSGIIVKAVHLEAKLERVLERMSENGKDVSEVQPLIEEFKAKIDLAKQKFEEAQDKFISITDASETLSDDEKRELFDSAKELMAGTRATLKDANSLLRDIFKKLKEVNGLEELKEDSGEEETEVDEESSEETTEDSGEEAETTSA